MPDQDIYDLAEEWIDAEKVYAGIKKYVTDTMSHMDSLLLDLGVDESPMIRVGKTGKLYLGSSNSYLDPASSSTWDLYTNGGHRVRFGPDLISIRTVLGFSPAGPANPDTYLYRDGAGILAQRNGLNSQKFCVYNTYNDDSNYERAVLAYDSNVLKIGHEAVGTGSFRRMELLVGWASGLLVKAGGSNVTASIGESLSGFAGAVGIGGGGSSPDTIVERVAAKHIRLSADLNNTDGAALEIQEVSTPPAAPTTCDGVVLYSEDNGSGKTRLMALFPSGAAQQMAIEP